MGHVKSFEGKTPRIHPSAFIADGCHIIGDVVIGEGASVWPGAVLRGDLAPITVGPNSNIQDNAVVHTITGVPTTIGANVTVGHGAIVHACTIGNDVMIGMGSVVLDRAVVEDGAVVGACAMVSEGKVVTALTLVVGVPAKPLRELPPEAAVRNRELAGRYVALALRHKVSPTE